MCCLMKLKDVITGNSLLELYVLVYWKPMQLVRGAESPKHWGLRETTAWEKVQERGSILRAMAVRKIFEISNA